jgi:hypothetical protein
MRSTLLLAPVIGTAIIGGCLRAQVRTSAIGPTTCAGLASTQIKSASIRLPTTGAVITATQMIAASGTGASAVGDYCLVSGSIRPVDKAAPDVQFQVALPARWNAKVLMLGGGGYDGAIPQVAGNIFNTTADALAPLARGYAVFASDGGHQSRSPVPALDGSFAVNEEAYRNWMGDALKKTRDAALVLVKAAYGRSPTFSYFVGSSTGGREGLTVAGRWPADWDGVVALYPARDVTAGIFVGLLATTRALAEPGAYPNAAKREVLYRAALATCDLLDGANDGVISNVRGCEALFTPATTRVNGVPVRCPGGADTGDACLSDTQLTALDRINSPVPFNFRAANGERSVPGYPVLTSDTGIPNTSPLEAMVSFLGLGSAPPAFPPTDKTAFAPQFVGDFIRYALAGGTETDPLRFDPSNPGRFAAQLSELSSLDISDTDLTAFSAKGGKVLMMQGTADLLISPRATEAYYRHLQATMGTANVDSFLRYYEVPGFAHSTSTVFNASWDQLSALENWVEKHEDPANKQIVTDVTGVPGRTRPLCKYPGWPKYKGTGNVNDAASFFCAVN